MKAIIVAVDKELGIAKDNRIPWHFKEDFSWFKEKTKGAIMVMGYNTYAEIAEKFNYPESGKLLPGRVSYVVSSKDIPACKTVKTGFTSVAAVLADIEANHPNKDVFFLGGVGIFKEALEIIDKLYVTKIYDTYNCTSFFPVEIEDYANTKFNHLSTMVFTECKNLAMEGDVKTDLCIRTYEI